MTNNARAIRAREASLYRLRRPRGKVAGGDGSDRLRLDEYVTLRKSLRRYILNYISPGNPVKVSKLSRICIVLGRHYYAVNVL